MALAAPASTLAQAVNDGGASAPSASGTPAVAGGTAPTATPAGSGPNTLRPPPALSGSIALVRGQLTAGAAGRVVTLAMFDARRGWTPIGGGRADASGGFAISWRPRHLGRFLLRASVAGRPAATDPVAAMEVYRPVIATWFGPGSYGSRTACGQIMTPELIGVAHRSLPCGTMVDIVYGNQTISVPVVDRGPYASGVSYDLTTATAAALGVSDTVHIGALAIHPGTPAGLLTL